MTYEEYEKLCDIEINKNDKYLEMFEAYLREKGYSEATVSRHLRNVNFYIDIFLLYSDIIPMEKGPEEISMFLGYYFIRKCGWSTPETIKSNAASLKKFYRLMADKGYISERSYDDMVFIIKDEMPQWQHDCKGYNDGGNPFLF